MTKKKKNLSKKSFILATIFFLSVIAVINYTRKYKKININGYEIVVEIASTNKQRVLGLSGKRQICQKCGMLFIFDKTDKYKFWMKDMRFDIDIVWIDEGIVVDQLANASYKNPGVILNSQKPFKYVLELPAGSIKKMSILIGQKINM